MGHQREDYDALGGIVGVAAIARALGKTLRIVRFQKETSAIDKMVNVLNESEFWKSILLLQKRQSMGRCEYAHYRV